MRVFGYFKKDRRDGTFEIYSEDGKLQQKQVYQNGRAVRE
jgi:antitoxin component YwqK of YwqJK toxin-antitoxin module